MVLKSTVKGTMKMSAMVSRVQLRVTQM